jgi:hypothetical protein
LIVAFQPGGTIKDARVVLGPDEKMPNRFNVMGAIVYREDPDNGHQWVMVKDRFVVLPSDSDLLSHPKLPEVDIFTLTTPEEPATFEHADIIRLGEGDD